LGIIPPRCAVAWQFVVIEPGVIAMKRSSVLCALVSVLLLGPSALEAADERPVGAKTTTYMVQMRLVEEQSGKPTRVLAEPTIVTAQGRPASMRVGGEFEPPGNEPSEPIEFGTKVDVTIRPERGDRLLVNLRLEISERIERSSPETKFAVVSTGIHTLLSVEPGKTFVVPTGTVKDGEKRTRLEVTVFETARPK